MSVQIASSQSSPSMLSFDHGVAWGLDWFKRGDTPNVPPTPAMIVEFIQYNILDLAAEGLLDDHRLQDMSGFLVGWISAQYVGEKQ